MKNFLKSLYTKLNMKTGKKYKLTDECITIDNRKLYRIKALKDFSCIKKGDEGGFVESEDNLSQEGNCWILDNAKVFGNAVVRDNAMIYGNVMIYNGAEVRNNARVFGDAKVYNYSNVQGNASVSGSAQVYDNVQVYGNAAIYDNAIVYSNAVVSGNAKVFGNAEVFNNILMYGEAEIGGYAKIANNSDYIVFKNWWSSGRYFTWTRSDNMWRVGCFYGTSEELIEKAYNDSELSGREYERVVKYVESILKDSKK